MKFQLNFGTSHPLPPFLEGGDKSAPPQKIPGLKVWIYLKCKIFNIFIYITLTVHKNCLNQLVLNFGRYSISQYPSFHLLSTLE